MTGEAQRVINVIGQVVEKNIANGARVHYTPGVVHEGSGAYEASAYVWVEELLEDIEVEAGSYVGSGDYVVVAISGEGRAWVDRILPTSLYARMVADYNRGRIGFGDGESAPEDFGEPGQALLSAGDGASAYWGNVAGGEGGGVTDHGALTGLADDDHSQYRREDENHTHASTGLQGGTVDHGVLTGLGDDDHPQYTTAAEAETLAEAEITAHLAAASHGGIASGTSNPGSPSSGDLFFRTDLGLLIYYNGTRWLTVQQHIVPLVAVAEAITASISRFASGALPTHLDVWAEAVQFEYYFGGTGSYTMTVYRNLFDESNYPSVVSRSTSGTTAGRWYNFRDAINAVWTTTGGNSGTNTSGIRFDVTESGDASIYATATLFYRLIVT